MHTNHTEFATVSDTDLEAVSGGAKIPWKPIWNGVKKVATWGPTIWEAGKSIFGGGDKQPQQPPAQPQQGH